MPDLAIKSLRARYRPSCVQVLFVGEAPPANGTFFYDGNTQMFRYVRDALSGHFGHPADFLAESQRRNYILDNFVLDPSLKAHRVGIVKSFSSNGLHPSWPDLPRCARR